MGIRNEIIDKKVEKLQRVILVPTRQSYIEGLGKVIAKLYTSPTHKKSSHISSRTAVVVVDNPHLWVIYLE